MERTEAHSDQTARAAAANTPFALPPLPFEENALAPIISARTLRYHYGKHHKGYVDKLNGLVQGTDYADMSLEEIIKATSGDRTQAKIFNNAAQIWNHTFYWQCLSPDGGKPAGSLLQAIEQDFGGLDELKATLAKTAEDRFGSGWAGLIMDGGKLKVIDTANAETPIMKGQKCLLTIDVWEHAYYLDYQNDRKAHLKAVIDNLLNWKFAARNFEQNAH